MPSTPTYITVKVALPQKWFSPRTCRRVGWLVKQGEERPLYDTGERLPGGIPVLAVRREEE